MMRVEAKFIEHLAALSAATAIATLYDVFAAALVVAAYFIGRLAEWDRARSRRTVVVEVNGRKVTPARRPR